MDARRGRPPCIRVWLEIVSAYNWWLRSPNLNNSNNAWNVNNDGNYNNNNCTNTNGVRPALMNCETSSPSYRVNAVRHHQREPYPVESLRVG